jgi:hypothetical protein
MKFRNFVFVAITFASCGFALGAGTMLLEDLDPVFNTNPVLHQTLLQAFDLWDRASATGRDSTRATDKNPPWMLYGKPKGASGPYTVQIELQLAPHSWPKSPRWIGLRITPIDPEIQKEISGQ